jgi:2-iminoacetate synthase
MCQLSIDEAKIGLWLEEGGADAGRVREILSKARALGGLEETEVCALAGVTEPELLEEIYAAAREVKETIYGRRLVLFAPLYVSNLCGNECVYCAFRAGNRGIRRKALSQSEIEAETLALIRQGHKRVLLVAGESYPVEGFDYIIRAIEAVYRTREGRGEVRRVNVNVAPLELDEFKQLKAAGIGTYQLFQETYDRRTYAAVHRGGRKADFEWRISAMDRAMQAGIDDVGIGVLFGLADWRFEILALMQHIRHLEKRFGVGPHTISMPRLEPAQGSDVAAHPPAPVSDADFKKIVAILRLAVPYTGMIMSTREGAAMRRETFALGVSQISAGSRTNPGGYAQQEVYEQQFCLGDHRTLDEVVRDVAALGYIPSFCTACYRLGRTGRDFMDLAKPGEIKKHCEPNALSTFQEYLIDYASPQTRAVGEKLIAALLEEMEPQPKGLTRLMLERIFANDRDVYV